MWTFSKPIVGNPSRVAAGRRLHSPALWASPSGCQVMLTRILQSQSPRREREPEREPKRERERERHYYLLVLRPESLTIKSALFYLFDVRP